MIWPSTTLAYSSSMSRLPAVMMLLVLVTLSVNQAKVVPSIMLKQSTSASTLLSNALLVRFLFIVFPPTINF